MKGGSTTQPNGFTIVETLIVLAVTGVILSAALILVGGRQAKTQFQVGINQTQQMIQQIIGEVQNGYYPNNGQVNCTANTPSPLLSKVGGTGQGANTGCILLGKVAQFGASGKADQIVLVPVAGNRLNGTSEVTTLTQAGPIGIAPHASTDVTTPDASEARPLLNGITANAMWQNGNPANKLGSVGFISNLASYNTATGALDSGTQQVSLYGIANTQIGDSTFVDANAISASNLVAVNQVDICFASGTTNQSGQVTIGGSGRQLSVTMKIWDGKTCNL